MPTAREAVLTRIAAANRAVSAAAPPRATFEPGAPVIAADAVNLFVVRLLDYGARALVTDEPGTAADDILAELGADRTVVPGDLESRLRPSVGDVIVDGDMSPRDLDRVDAAVTTCAWACAETGTLAFDGGPGQGRRAVSLVPDVHVCHLASDRIVLTVPELLARLEPAARAARPITLVSGPSATSDIELQRIEGVHGPRILAVVIDVSGVPGGGTVPASALRMTRQE